ncbi:unnamed protein product [Enterobius vermicularis]|uniref:Ovule protein n=1 Tax=Enterobius vermicularis TaxID=51028 RepID=A0A0N4UTS4_ENTVE|nr:unnamed protein product [Enterobius vermicularis]
MPNPFLQWNPWFLQTSIPTQNKSMTPGMFQVPHVDSSKQWNSPNSVDSGQKSECSSTDGPHIDPVGMEIGEASPVSSSSEKHTSPEVPPIVFTPKAEPLSALNPLILRQHMEQQRCVSNSDRSKEQLLEKPQHQNFSFTNHNDRDEDHKILNDNIIKGGPLIPRGVDNGIRCNQLSQMQFVQHLLSKKQFAPSLAARTPSNLSSVIAERKKAVPDDCLKMIRRKGISKNTIENIKIPVPQATKCDPSLCFCVSKLSLIASFSCLFTPL